MSFAFFSMVNSIFHGLIVVCSFINQNRSQSISQFVTETSEVKEVRVKQVYAGKSQESHTEAEVTSSC